MIDHFPHSKPYVRWWWFASPINLEEVQKQLEWTQSMGFGGVEIAWLYPYEKKIIPNTPHFLGKEWEKAVLKTVEICRELDLGCDFTTSTAWPFCGSFLPKQYQSKNGQTVDKSWEKGYSDTPVPVLDHFHSEAVSFYLDYYFNHGFHTFAERMPGCSFFCDSLEVEISAPQDCINHPDKMYDFRSSVAKDYYSEFFQTYVQKVHETGACARIQAHGAMVNLLDAYALADIPETESILFYPRFGQIAASAAAIAGRKNVSSETFTCLYGWVPAPEKAPFIRNENLMDMKALADSQFAFGVNQVFFHGMPFWGKEFYATTHIAPDSPFAAKLPLLNQYLTNISEKMKSGVTYSRLAVLFPIEDQFMRENIPEHLRTISNNYYWECQEVVFPKETLPYRPIFCSSLQLDHSIILPDGKIQFASELVVDALYISSSYLDYSVLPILERIAKEGATLIWDNPPLEPGTIKHQDYSSRVNNLLSYSKTLNPLRRFLISDEPLDYWVRKDGNLFLLFFSHPKTQGLHYPLKKDFSDSLLPEERKITIQTEQHQFDLNLAFKQNGSILLEIDDSTGSYRIIDCLI